MTEARSSVCIYCGESIVRDAYGKWIAVWNGLSDCEHSQRAEGSGRHLCRARDLLPGDKNHG